MIANIERSAEPRNVVAADPLAAVIFRCETWLASCPQVSQRRDRSFGFRMDRTF